MAETKKLEVKLPIEYWQQLRRIQKVVPYKDVPLVELAKQFIIERMDQIHLEQERLDADRQKPMGGEIELNDIGINIDVMPGKDK